MSRRHVKSLSGLATAALLAVLQLACGSDEGGSGSGTDTGADSGTDTGTDTDPDPTLPVGDFESANPGGPEGSGATGSVGVAATNGNSASSTSTTGGSDGSGGSGGGAGGEDPDRVIEEADIVKVEGDRLYAMSRYGGVAAIDIADVDQPKLLTRHRIEATPFEMYVDDGIIFALYQDYGEYIYDEDAGTASYVQSSHVVVIDASDPALMTELERFAIPGYISDSRIVGDILYVAAFEDGYCWSCAENQPRTNVMALNVADPSKVEKVDELSFADQEGSYGWRRSLTVTDERMYVAGPVWGNDGPVGSTIQVVDISDPTGDLVEGDTVQVTGQVNSRWQMDEYEGVLRVISQPFEWDLSVPPSVETFTVNSADDLEPLGALQLELPRPEQLQSVRFDGERGYAITFERTDPLFTIDLSNPETPVQAGMLEMPGWLYHMEPRGDRLVGLGFDQDNPEGALAVSLFDVSDLSEPSMIDRANFGGDWGWMVEDQDRIHKAFRLFEEEGLIVMPFNGYVYPEDEEYCYSGNWVSGVQLIDWQDDQLATRGVAEMSSEARRGFLHDERLVTVSDDRVEVFDIADRDAPTRTGNVALAQYVSRTLAAGDRAVRIGQSWYTAKTELDVVPLAEVSTPRSSTGFDLEFDSADSCYSSLYMSEAFASEDKAYLVFTGYDYSDGQGKDVVRVATLDVTGSEGPELVGTADLEVAPSDYTYDSSLPDLGRRVVRVGDALAFNHQLMTWNNVEYTLSESGVYVMDLSDPAAAKAQYVELPSGLGASALFVDGNVVARSHYVASDNDRDNVRFYLERIDLENPAEPRRLPSLNVPGSVIALSGDRALTVDFEYHAQQDVLINECYENARVVSFEITRAATDTELERGTCTSVIQVLTLIHFEGEGVEVLGTETLQPDEDIAHIAMGDSVMFATVNRPYYYYPGGLDCYYCFYYGANKLKVLTLGGLTGGALTIGRIEIDQGDNWYYGGEIVASGDRALVSSGWRSELTLLDASDPEQPEVVRKVPVGGYISDLTVVGSTAIVSMGYDGVQAISFED